MTPKWCRRKWSHSEWRTHMNYNGFVMTPKKAKSLHRTNTYELHLVVDDSERSEVTATEERVWNIKLCCWWLLRKRSHSGWRKHTNYNGLLMTPKKVKWLRRQKAYELQLFFLMFFRKISHSEGRTPMNSNGFLMFFRVSTVALPPFRPSGLRRST